MIYAHPTRLPTLSSPYSSAEFPYAEKDAKMQDLELEWRLRKERLDMMNHRFWVGHAVDNLPGLLPALKMQWETSS